MEKEFIQKLKEYLDLKEQLLTKFNEIRKYEYKYDTLNLGNYDGWYELCELEVEVYDNLKFVYEDQDLEEEDVLNFTVSSFVNKRG